MAEAYLNHFYGNRYEAYSAGTHPTKINPIIVEVMAEDGIDLCNARSKSIEEFLDWNFDLVVTVCDHAKDDCPFFPGDELVHRSFKDPSVINGSEIEGLNQVREIRDEIKKWITIFFK
jgi:arsenate reductase